MNAYYEKIEASVDETIGMTLYVVYYEAVRGGVEPWVNAYIPFGVYENEETAKAVVNAINEVIIRKTQQL